MTTPNTQLWEEARKRLHLEPDYSQSMKCAVCGEPLGRKGDTPMVKEIGPNMTKTYRHQGCNRG